jgi:hypothetical protein
MPITFEEVDVDAREPEREAAPAPAPAANAGAEVEEKIEQFLRLRGERERRLCAD